MLSVSSTLSREGRWLGSNIALLLAYTFVFLLLQATISLLLSTDGSVAAGWDGNPVEQVVGWAVLGGWMASIYSPLSVVILVPYRVASHITGHSRLLAFAFALIGIVICRAVGPDLDPGTILVLAVYFAGYAAVIWLPGQASKEPSPALKGAVIGIALSTIWIVGSVLSIGWGTYRASKGDRIAGGALSLFGCLVPGMMLFADLFRADVPGENYLVTALLVGGLVWGTVLMLRRSHRSRVIAPT